MLSRPAETLSTSHVLHSRLEPCLRASSGRSPEWFPTTGPSLRHSRVPQLRRLPSADLCLAFKPCTQTGLRSSLSRVGRSQRRLRTSFAAFSPAPAPDELGRLALPCRSTVRSPPHQVSHMACGLRDSKLRARFGSELGADPGLSTDVCHPRLVVQRTGYSTNAALELLEMRAPVSRCTPIAHHSRGPSRPGIVGSRRRSVGRPRHHHPNAVRLWAVSFVP
jgi:hypothetical protein